MFSRIVVKGKDKHPLCAFLTGKDTNPNFAGEVSWNFGKFLLGRNGQVLSRFEPGDAPESPKVLKAIESALSGS